jgi:hypothetical protein
MAILTRRCFLLSGAALSVGCVGRGTVAMAPMGAAARVRQPAVDQTWRYARYDLVTGLPVDTQIDRVSAVGQIIEIESHSEATKDEPIKYPSWGAPWQHKYLVRDTPAGPLPSEVQEPWGMVLVDSHWTQLQVYEKPIPLWPKEMRPGWSTTVGTYYKIPDSEETMPWQLTMRAERWESITVPAGSFTALRFFNLIDFRYTNVAERTAAQRMEHIWFAPEIGRWVLRESSGTFRESVGFEVKESSYRWELLSWT